jgi:hypothetical protein
VEAFSLIRRENNLGYIGFGLLNKTWGGREDNPLAVDL